MFKKRRIVLKMSKNGPKWTKIGPKVGPKISTK